MRLKTAAATAGASALVATIAPLVVLRMMARNNNNGELYDAATGQVDLGYAVQVGAITYFPTLLMIFALTSISVRLWRRRARAAEQGQSNVR